MGYIIKNATLVNEGESFLASVAVSGEFIEKIARGTDAMDATRWKGYTVIDARGKYLLPGVIDDQVHFREPGLTYKADIRTESRAAVAGGVTSFMDMPNTVPNTLTQQLLQQKYDIAAEKSYCNYSFYMGASNDNIEEVLKTNPREVCGIKVFMGSSTGNMLVDKEEILERIFREVPCLVATHCEDEIIIRANIAMFKERYGDDAPAMIHPLIRSAEACYRSSSKAVEIAEKYNTRLHVLHVSTEKEMSLFRNDIPLKDKMITSEVCLHHLWFNDKDYESKGNFIKWNPAVKTEQDRSALLAAVIDNRIDVVATDHAPHTLEEKSKPYFSAPSGGPSVQHLLTGLMEFINRGVMTLEKVVEKLSHNPAILFGIDRRGFIREGYYADLVIINPDKKQYVNNENVLYKCGWTPYNGIVLSNSVDSTFVNGSLVYHDGIIEDIINAKRLIFNR